MTSETRSRLSPRSHDALALGALVVAFVFALLSPKDVVQGDLTRMLYIHVPAIITAYAAFGLTTVATVGYLVKRDLKWDRWAAASAEVGVVFLGLAHSEDLGDHITIDLIYVRLGQRMRAVFNVFANLLSVAIVGLMAYQLYDFSRFTRNTGEETGILEWPIWPFVVIAAFGSAVFALAIASKLVLRRLGEPVDAGNLEQL